MNKKPLLPPALHKGDTIGIMAPSSRVDRKILERGIKALETAGYGVYVHPQTWLRDGQSAGRPHKKAAALHDLLINPSVKAVFCARGGNRAADMLEKIDYGLVRRNPKIIMGYSDVTALLHAIHKKSGLVTFHGPMVTDFGRGKISKAHAAHCFNLLAGGQAGPLSNPGRSILNAGKAKGRLAGGNLSLICSLMGTPWQPDFNDTILFLEDCNEELSRIDRMFRQLANAGVFRQISGLVLGDFSKMLDTGSMPFGRTLKDIVRDAVAGAKIPIVTGAPFGHGKDLYALPVGAIARLDAKGSKALLRLDGPVVKA